MFTVATYHNHSTYSDGKATIGAIVAAARAQGVAEVGVSDHLVLHGDGRQPSWSMPLARLGDYLADLSGEGQRSAAAGGPAVRIGLEVDWFPEAEGLIRRTLQPLPLDYVIGSVHYVNDFTIDGSPHRWKAMSQDQRNKVHREYWRLMRGMAGSGVFDIVAHIDLAKKFGFQATVDLRGLIEAALDAVADSGMVVELNTSGWHKPCADCYPSLEILRWCQTRRIPVTLSADAHQPEHLRRDFDKGARRLREAGYAEVARFEGRRVRLEPMPHDTAG